MSPIRSLLALLVATLVLAGCSGGPAPSATGIPIPSGAVVVTAKDRTFDTSTLLLPADVAFKLAFVNRDGEAHNIAIRTKAGFEGDVVFRHDPVTATTVVLDAGPIAAGTYFFLCEVHPTMTGTVIVH